MVEAVEAWKASNGQLFGTRIEALTFEARAELTRLVTDSQVVDAILQHGRELHQVLAALYAPQCPAGSIKRVGATTSFSASDRMQG